ncbi:MAG TPA: DUF192 domain-containing protein [Polyangiaceae bacterium]
MRLAVLGIIASVLLASCAVLAPTERPLRTETIRIETANGTKSFMVEIAADATSQKRGLMYRRDLPPNAGMLFDFHQEGRVSFWMKNTPLPLDMVFIKADGTVSSVEPNAVPYSTASIASAEPVRAVLEINGGLSFRLGIKPGDRVHAAMFHSD